ncbi:cell division protein FtsA [Mangrovibacillus cuniculi]|uniref:Cell division protein FtsA n=1 Tax=Mangrovibacillus cuniculi TaxID=2593652 RepID=A0A7S8CAA8_9BACI|nr:cell division protein FtsA [Mangrovibacillus cuniculi]QPC46263.1 cell division protein FtsA [Mangrovibacillus cuniculi]
MNNQEYYISLDIGTSSVKVILCEMVQDSLTIIGVGNVRSQGIKKGLIVDMEATVQSIRKAVEKAERVVGATIRDVIVTIPATQATIQPSDSLLLLPEQNHEITSEDIGKVIEGAQIISIPPEKEIINFVPEQFLVDEIDEILDPRGMTGKRLEVEGFLTLTSKTMLHNMLRAVEKAGLNTLDIVLQPLGAGMMALSDDEREHGVALVDIGGGSTTVSLFYRGHLQHTFSIPIGGERITSDLAIGLSTSQDEAELIKRKYGHAFVDDASDEVYFSVPKVGSDQHQQFNQVEVADMIEARLEELFYFIQDELARLNVRDLPGGFVLTGGVVNLPGVLDLAQEVLKNRTRAAVPDYLGVREPEYTTSIGTILFAHQMAKLQGISLTVNTSPNSESGEVKSNKNTKPVKQKNTMQDEEKDDKPSAMKRLLGYFFD